MTIRRSLILATAVLAGALMAPATAQTDTSTHDGAFVPEVGQSGKDVIWVPTPQALVDRMLDMASLTADDTLVDLGSGDGRTVITAAKRGARARGIEYNPDMVALSRSAALREGVADRATFEQADIFESDFSDATVVTLFLLPGLNMRLRPTLLDMAPGTRVVSNSFTMGDWEPDETSKAENCQNYCIAYMWVVPAKVEGTWKTPAGELTLTQTFQMVQGTLQKGGQTVPLEGRLNGAQLTLKAGNDEYVAQVSGSKMQGTLNGEPWSAAL
ncbi:SAM-dependent methyltransferase [Yanghanlia caeni]|uniref:Class I SAM-dependent methyltransferase n=1 Tax=Yanghanlia caeni TaxID=3064283 RepID=A0ABU1D9J3_9BURK|nr:class I SAM-dependent methyltransferase [Alcaligenaceae bacterium LG-2]HZH55997.1 class I SAM-dependent methyltransferase [Burkholderiaceae bacterium]